MDTLQADGEIHRVDLTESENWYLDEMDGNVVIEFRSDGSIIEAGFSITIQNASKILTKSLTTF